MQKTTNQNLASAATYQQAALSMIVRNADIVRFAMRDPDLSQSEIDDITGINDFPAKISEYAPLRGGITEVNGWFALRTCSAQFFKDNVAPLHKGDIAFWFGVLDGYRTGIKMGEPKYLQHAKDLVEVYAYRILLQLEISKYEGLRDDFYPSWERPMGDALAGISSLIVQSPILYPKQKDPMQALLDDISEHHDTSVGLGDYIIYSKSEKGYWNNSFGWVSSKGAATPFDAPSDIFILPGSGDAYVASFHKEPDSSECSAKYRSKMA